MPDNTLAGGQISADNAGRPNGYRRALHFFGHGWQKIHRLMPTGRAGNAGRAGDTGTAGIAGAKGGAGAAGAIIAAALALALAGCGNRYHYPPSKPGWHSPNYHIVFGVLQTAGRHGLALAIEYARSASHNRYGGELTLTPPGALAGFATGEEVLLHGEVIQTGTGPRYYVRRARLWLGVGQPSYLTR